MILFDVVGREGSSDRSGIASRESSKIYQTVRFSTLPQKMKFEFEQDVGGHCLRRLAIAETPVWHPSTSQSAFVVGVRTQRLS